MASAAGPYLDEVLVTEALVALFAAGYYVLMRVLEEQGLLWATKLLGGGVPPQYPADTGTESSVPEWRREDDPARPEVSE